MAVRRSVVAACMVAAAGLAAVGSLPGAWAQPGGQPERQGPGGRQPGGPGGEGRAPSIEAAMNRMERAFEALKPNLGDASKKEENLQAVWAAQQGCAMAKRGKPEPKTMDAAKALAEFRKNNFQLMKHLIDLEAAIMEDKAEDAKAAYAKVMDLREKSHKAFGVDENKDRERPGGPGGAPRGG